MRAAKFHLAGRWILACAGATAACAADWPMLGGRPDRNMVVEATALPDTWSWEEGGDGKNIRWTAPLGHVTYGAPVISEGRVFIGTNLPEDDKRKGGVLKCFAEKDGSFVNSSRWLQWKKAAVPPPGRGGSVATTGAFSPVFYRGALARSGRDVIVRTPDPRAGGRRRRLPCQTRTPSPERCRRSCP